MAEPLKNMYNPFFFERICPVLKTVIPKFDEQCFIHYVHDEKWPDLELKERVRQITQALHQCISKDYTSAIEVVVALTKALRKTEEREQGFALIFLADYVEVYGQDHFKQSMVAIEEITQLVSCEFAIRPFLLRYPEKTFQQLSKWSKHTSASVRRLASEGCRPRLPWAMGIPCLKKNPEPIIRIIKNLKNDSSEYVRRSVANNLNDIAKDHPDLVLDLAKEWYGESAETDWIIKHGCRTLLKKGNSAALLLQGINPKSKAEIKLLTLSQSVIKIGQHLEFQFEFTNKEPKSSRFRLDYAIDYITSSGKISTKVFKVQENIFEAKKAVAFKRKQSFQNFTTRKHYKGKHCISILVNGQKKLSKEFEVC